jgi:FkbM family methyltransferase
MSQIKRLYHIGPHSIILPPEHMLDQYQYHWKRYDLALGEIARIIHKRNLSFSAIDIGANIGDTAALLCKYGPIPVLCIEGNPSFVSVLKVNAAQLGNHIEIEECFIGIDGNSIAVSHIDQNGGTASLIGTPIVGSSEMTVPMKSLETVIAAHPHFANASLVKIDTDGFDFQILTGSLNVLRRLKPVLFFEYDPSFSSTGETEALQAIHALFAIGYSRYLIYDNFGNCLMTLRESERFAELNAYLRSNKKNGCAVYYFDVCAFMDSDAALFDEIRSFELSS